MANERKISPEDESIRLITLDAVVEIVQLSRSCIYRDVADGNFPRPLKLGSSSRWVASEVHAWFRKKIAERDEAVGKRNSDDII